MRARSVWAAGAVLGEGPVWSPEDQALLFLDIKGRQLMRFDLATGQGEARALPERVSWIVRRRDGGWLAGAAGGFADIDMEQLTLQPFGHPEPDRPHNRFNDAKVDPRGRLWVGTMDDREQEAIGAVYRLDADRRWIRLGDGYRVPNGPTFSLDGRSAWHADSARRMVWRYRLDDEGAVSGRDPWLSFEPDWGYPDGMATDAEGCVWIACWGGAAVMRFDPDGRRIGVTPIPALQPTSVAFAGPSLDRLFVTTAAVGREHEPGAGDLFEVEAAVSGAPVHLYAG